MSKPLDMVSGRGKVFSHSQKFLLLFFFFCRAAQYQEKQTISMLNVAKAIQLVINTKTLNNTVPVPFLFIWFAANGDPRE